MILKNTFGIALVLTKKDAINPSNPPMRISDQESSNGIRFYFMFDEYMGLLLLSYFQINICMYSIILLTQQME